VSEIGSSHGRPGRYLPGDWTLPRLNDQNRPFFTSGHLAVQRCESCGERQHPPMDVCRFCQGQTFTYPATLGEGRISSFTIVHRAADRRLDAVVPYNVIVVELEDPPGVMVVGNLVEDGGGGGIEIGARVRAVFAEVPDPDTGDLLLLPQWQLS
jgi:uncharacterized OB-fold protein